MNTLLDYMKDKETPYSAPNFDDVTTKRDKMIKDYQDKLMPGCKVLHHKSEDLKLSKFKNKTKKEMDVKSQVGFSTYIKVSTKVEEENKKLAIKGPTCFSCLMNLKNSENFWFVDKSLITKTNHLDEHLFFCFLCFGNDSSMKNLISELKQDIQSPPRFNANDTIRLRHVLNCTYHPFIDGKIWFTNSTSKRPQNYYSNEKVLLYEYKLRTPAFQLKLKDLDQLMKDAEDPNCVSTLHYKVQIR
jgi:hypothetical protein